MMTANIRTTAAKADQKQSKAVPKKWRQRKIVGIRGLQVTLFVGHMMPLVCWNVTIKSIDETSRTEFGQ